MTTLGENLKKIRKAKKMTQKELAQKSGVKQSVISDLETGNAKSTGSILELANALGVTAEELKKGEKVQLVGFGTFEVSERAAREGRNPQTGETMEIKASKTPKFKAGKALKDMMN